MNKLRIMLIVATMVVAASLPVAVFAYDDGDSLADQPTQLRWDDASGTYKPVAAPECSEPTVPTGPFAEIRLFGGAAEVYVDDSEEMQSITDRQLVGFKDHILVKLYKSGAVDFGENGFIRLDSGWAFVYLYKDGTIRVVSQGAQIFADECKNLIREGRGRWTITRQ